MSSIKWVGKTGNQGRVGRGSNLVNLSETRWIVPAKPYEAPRGSMERAENMILMGAGIVTIIFAVTFMVISAV